MPSIKIIKAEIGGLSGKNGHYLDHVSKKAPSEFLLLISFRTFANSTQKSPRHTNYFLFH